MMHKNSPPTALEWIFLGSLLTLTIPSQAADAANAYDENWIKINQYSPIEGYESHGSYGWHIGVGIMQTESSEKSGYSLRSEDKSASNLDKTKIEVPRIFITRGTRWPIDFGFSLASFEGGSGRQLGGHLQWTIFEGFRKPAIALRISHMRATSMPDKSQLNSDSISFGISQNFLRYLNLALGVGMQRHSISRNYEQDSDHLLTLKPTQGLSTIDGIFWSICLKTNLFSPFTSIAIEQIYSPKMQTVSLAKLSYML